VRIPGNKKVYLTAIYVAHCSTYLFIINVSGHFLTMFFESKLTPSKEIIDPLDVFRPNYDYLAGV